MAKRNVNDIKKTATPGGKKLFPVGKTLVKVTWAEKSVSGTGNERITLTYEGQTNDSKGQKIRDDLYYDLAQVQWKVAAVTESLGVIEFDPDDAKDLLNTFVGKEMAITVVEDEYTNRDGDATIGRKISTYDSLDATVAAKQRAERAKRFGNSSGASRADRAAEPAGTTEGEGEGATDGEVPF